MKASKVYITPEIICKVMGLQEKNTQARVGGHSIGCLTNTTEGCQGHEK